MAPSHELEALTKAFSGFGVEEKSLISILGKWHPEQRRCFRKGSPQFFTEDDRDFERWNDAHIAQLHHEFLRFTKAVVLWAMHPWERDGGLARKGLSEGTQSYEVLIEIACTRSSEELLGTRRAYHSLFHRSIEEDVADHIAGPQRKLLSSLVSSYRYEGSRVNEGTVKSEAKMLNSAIKNASKKKPIEDEEVVRILATRSKLHLKGVFKHYKEMYGKNLDEDLEDDLILKQTVQCLCTPQTYFSKVLDGALKHGVDEDIKEALTRVIVTRADVDMKEIKEEYHRQYGVALSNKIEERANGNFREFLLTLIARGD